MTEHTLSPLDGRNAHQTEPLRAYFSESAYVRLRVCVEIDYLIALSAQARLVRPLSNAEQEFLHGITGDWGHAAEREVNEFERQTRHDVKAIEYFPRARLARTSLNDDYHTRGRRSHADRDQR